MGRWTARCGNHVASVIISEHVAWKKVMSSNGDVRVEPVFGYCYDDKIESEAHDENGNLKENDGYFCEAIFITEESDTVIQELINDRAAADISTATVKLSVYTKEAEKIELETKIRLSAVHTNWQTIHRVEWELSSAKYSTPISKYKERPSEDRFFNEDNGLENGVWVEKLLEKIGNRLGELDIVEEFKAVFEDNALDIGLNVIMDRIPKEGEKYYKHRAEVVGGAKWEKHLKRAEKRGSAPKNKLKIAQDLAKKATIWKWGTKIVGAKVTTVFGAMEAQKYFSVGDKTRGWFSVAVTAVNVGAVFIPGGLVISILISVTINEIANHIEKKLFDDVSDEDINNLPPEMFIGAPRQPIYITPRKLETPVSPIKKE